MGMKRPNIVGSLPQPVKLINTQMSLDSSLNKKEKDFAEAILKSIYQKFDDEQTYSDEVGVKEIDLILGRLESLLETKLTDFKDINKENINESLKENLNCLSEKQLIDLMVDIKTISETINSEINSTTEKFKIELFNFLSEESQEQSIKDEVITNDKKEEQIIKSNNEDTSNLKLDESNKMESKFSFTQEFLNTEEEIIELFNNLIEKLNFVKNKISENKEKIKNFISTKIEAFKYKFNIKRILKEYIVDSFKSLVKNVLIKIKLKKDDKLTGSIPEQFQQLKKFILDETDLLQRKVKKFVRGKSFKDFKKQYETSMKLLYTFMKLCQFLEEMMTTIKQSLKKLEASTQEIINNFGKNIINFAKSTKEAIKSCLSSALGAYYGPPHFIGLWVLGIASIITLICFLITQYEPLLEWFVNVLLPGLAYIILFFAYVISSGLPMLIWILDITQKIFFTLLDWFWPLFKFIVNDIIIGIIKNIVIPILTLVMDVLQWFIDVVGTFIMDVLAFTVNNIVIPALNIVIPILKFLLPIIKNIFIVFMDKIAFPILGVVLDILHFILKLIKPLIKPIFNILIPITLQILKLMGKILIILAKIIATVLIYIFELLDNFVSKIGKLFEYLYNFWDWVKNIGSWLGQKIWDWIKSFLPDWLVGFLECLGEALGYAWDAVCAVAGAIWNVVTFSWLSDHEDSSIPVAEQNRKNLLWHWENKLKENRELYTKIKAIESISSTTFADKIYPKLENALHLFERICKQLEKLIQKSSKNEIQQISYIDHNFIPYVPKYVPYPEVKNGYAEELEVYRKYVEVMTNRPVVFDKVNNANNAEFVKNLNNRANKDREITAKALQEISSIKKSRWMSNKEKDEAIKKEEGKIINPRKSKYMMDKARNHFNKRFLPTMDEADKLWFASICSDFRCDINNAQTRIVTFLDTGRTVMAVQNPGYVSKAKKGIIMDRIVGSFKLKVQELFDNNEKLRKNRDDINRNFYLEEEYNKIIRELHEEAVQMVADDPDLQENSILRDEILNQINRVLERDFNVKLYTGDEDDVEYVANTDSFLDFIKDYTIYFEKPTKSYLKEKYSDLEQMFKDHARWYYGHGDELEFLHDATQLEHTRNSAEAYFKESMDLQIKLILNKVKNNEKLTDNEQKIYKAYQTYSSPEYIEYRKSHPIKGNAERGAYQNNKDPLLTEEAYFNKNYGSKLFVDMGVPKKIHYTKYQDKW